MNNSITTLEGDVLEGDVLLINQFELISPTTVAGTFYGIAFTLFCLYVHGLVPRLRDNDRKNQAKFMLGYSIAIMLFGLYYLVSNAWVAQDAYIRHGSYPGGPFSYIESAFHTPVIIIGLSCQMLIDILTSAIQIWRVWVVWNGTRHARLVVILPTLCFLAWTALRLRSTILGNTLSSAEYLRLDARTDIAEIALQGTTTILCTLLISLLLTFEQWRQRKLIGKAQGATGYMKIVAMLTESYALESIWVLLLAVVPNAGVANFFGETTPYIEIIAYLLVQYRVVGGKAYESHKGQSNVSSLHWNHSNHVTTQFGETSELDDGGCHVSAVPGTSDMLPGSTIV